MNTKRIFIPLLLSGLLVGHVHSADHSGVLPFATEDVAAIAYLDLTAVDLGAILNEARELGAVPQDQLDDAATRMQQAQCWIDRLTQNGANRVYVLLRTSDFQHTGPTWVLPLSEDANADAVIQLVEANDLSAAPRVNRPSDFPNLLRFADGAVLGATNEAQMERLVKHRAGQPREEVGAALSELGDGDAGLVVFGDSDSRRVVREMLPRMPAPFAEIDGRLIANDLRWGGAVVDFPPELKVTIRVETSGANVAQTLQQSAIKGLELAKGMAAKLPALRHVRAKDIGQALSLLKPTVEGAAVKLSLGDTPEELVRIRELATPPITAAFEAARGSQRANQFHQIALAFHNYTSQHKAFPEQGNYDDAGRPLLSWRVHLLPYLGQQALYDKFHIDEPWDSPHNRKLVTRMPEIYADPNWLVRRAVGAGKTTFVAPIADETVFPPRKALPDGKPLWPRDVTDGTVNTIMFVEVIPERAVVWTKPEDWNADLDHPLRGLERTDRTAFVCAICDGSVHHLPNNVDPKKLRALLTRAGGEVVNW